MKRLVVLIICVAFCVTTFAQHGGTAYWNQLDSKSYWKRIDSVAYLVGVNFGSFLKGYDFGKLPIERIKQGMNDYLNAKGNPRDENFNKQFKISLEEMNPLFNTYLSDRRQATLIKNKEKEERFLAANKRKPGVVETSSGLQYKIITPGNSKRATNPKDTVWVLYTAKTLNGDMFDSAKEEPVRFILNRIIKGWTEGLQLIGEGGEIELYCPAALAYGEHGIPGIEPNATTIYNIKIDLVGRYKEPKSKTAR